MCAPNSPMSQVMSNTSENLWFSFRLQNVGGAAPSNFYLRGRTTSLPPAPPPIPCLPFKQGFLLLHLPGHSGQQTPSGVTEFSHVGFLHLTIISQRALVSEIHQQ